MAVLDLDSLLAPVSDENPCGEPMEDTQEYLALTNAAADQNQGVIADAETVEPDWTEIRNLALDMLGQTKDVRVSALLTAALLRTSGWAGLVDALELVVGYLTNYWDSVYPLIEDDGDTFFRTNALDNYMDPARIVEGIRDLVVAEAPLAGQVTVRDLERVRSPEAVAAAPVSAEDEFGETQAAPEPTGPSASLVSEVLVGADLEALQDVLTAIEAVDVQLAAFDEAVAWNLGTGMGPKFQALISLVDIAKVRVAEEVSRRVDGPDVVGEGDGDASGDATVQATGGRIDGRVNSPEDAIRALDMVCEYFRANEPSSPVPLVLERAKRLVRQDFLSIINDLAPDGVAQVQNILGIQDAQEY